MPMRATKASHFPPSLADIQFKALSMPAMPRKPSRARRRRPIAFVASSSRCAASHQPSIRRRGSSRSAARSAFACSRRSSMRGSSGRRRTGDIGLPPQQ